MRVHTTASVIAMLATTAACSQPAPEQKPLAASASSAASWRTPTVAPEEWERYVVRVDTLTVETARQGWVLIAEHMAAQSVEVMHGSVKVAVLGGIPAGAHLSVHGGGACAVVGGTVQQGATVHVEGGGATLIVQPGSSTTGLTVLGGAARILTSRIDPQNPFKECDAAERQMRAYYA